MSYQGSHIGGQNPPFLKSMRPYICHPAYVGYKPWTPRAPSLHGVERQGSGRRGSPWLLAVRREWQGYGKRTDHSYFLWDAGGKRHRGWEEQRYGSLEGAWSAWILPQLPGRDACAEAAGGDGGAASHVALWGAVYLFFFSVTLHNAR